MLLTERVWRGNWSKCDTMYIIRKGIAFISKWSEGLMVSTDTVLPTGSEER